MADSAITTYKNNLSLASVALANYSPRGTFLSCRVYEITRRPEEVIWPDNPVKNAAETGRLDIGTSFRGSQKTIDSMHMTQSRSAVKYLPDTVLTTFVADDVLTSLVMQSTLRHGAPSSQRCDPLCLYDVEDVSELAVHVWPKEVEMGAFFTTCQAPNWMAKWGVSDCSAFLHTFPSNGLMAFTFPVSRPAGGFGLFCQVFLDAGDPYAYQTSAQPSQRAGHLPLGLVAPDFGCLVMLRYSELGQTLFLRVYSASTTGSSASCQVTTTQMVDTGWRRVILKEPGSDHAYVRPRLVQAQLRPGQQEHLLVGLARPATTGLARLDTAGQDMLLIIDLGIAAKTKSGAERPAEPCLLRVVRLAYGQRLIFPPCGKRAINFLLQEYRLDFESLHEHSHLLEATCGHAAALELPVQSSLSLQLYNLFPVNGGAQLVGLVHHPARKLAADTATRSVLATRVKSITAQQLSPPCELVVICTTPGLMNIRGRYLFANEPDRILKARRNDCTFVVMTSGEAIISFDVCVPRSASGFANAEPVGHPVADSTSLS
ncbi:unnamed protein product [Protopolystoma xenopodis]|uniref:Uncharacterized protein n=1 Tax=Protopolystoma xenopodis TaxID=117903 RepID=A0A448XII9_9PLAT|nr:unnamed protein product [Protopolystoma xenopodis]